MTFINPRFHPKRRYLQEVKKCKSHSGSETSGLPAGKYTREEIENLPEPVQRYFHYCGYEGTQKADHAEVIWKESSIRLKPGQDWMNLKTFQHNFVSEPARLAYMKAGFLGFIPFEGRDKYHDGKGHMFGTLGRLVNIFDETAIEIAMGAAMVFLAEALVLPNIALQDYIVWQEIDENTAKARFIHKGINVGGTFHFTRKGEYIRFTTDERPYSKPGGGFEKQPFTARIDGYRQQGNLKIASEVAAIWNLPQGDFEYWKGIIERIEFNW